MKRAITIVIYLLVLAFLLLARQLYKKPLQDASLDFIPKLQEDSTDPVIGEWSIVSGVSDGYLQLGIISMIMIRLPKRHLAFYLVAILATMTSLRDVLALIYAEPRPYWLTSEIKGNTCTIDYGSPSFHTMSGATFFAALWLIFADSAYQEENVIKARRMKIAAGILALIFLGMSIV